MICDKAKFDFETNRKNTDYIKVMNSRAVYVLNIYYASLITGENYPIKIEINFLENIIHDCSESKINNIVTPDMELKSMRYDLLNIRINTYSLDEIILEKYRAVLTRSKLKERDAIDLYLLYEKDKDILKFDDDLIYEKIQSGSMICPDLYKNLKNNCKLLNDGNFDDSDDDIDRLILIEIDKKDYNEFKKKLFDKLVKICKLNKNNHT